MALQRFSGCRMTATDISQDALDVARENALANGARLRLLLGDLFRALPAGERFDLILCNPPYLSREDMERLQREVRREPALALYGGEDGLDFYRRLRQDFPQRLERGGCLLLEVGQGQAQEVCDLFAPYATRVHADLNGIGRVVEVRAPGRYACRDGGRAGQAGEVERREKGKIRICIWKSWKIWPRAMRSWRCGSPSRKRWRIWTCFGA